MCVVVFICGRNDVDGKGSNAAVFALFIDVAIFFLFTSQFVTFFRCILRVLSVEQGLIDW